MSLLGNNVFANPNTPIWGQGGGGGGSNFQTLNILQGGSLNIGSSINSGTEVNFYKDVSGTQQTSLTMRFSPAGLPATNLRLSVIDEVAGGDMLQAGDLRAYGQGNSVDNDDCIVLGNQGTGQLGLYRSNGQFGTTVATYATFASNAMDLSNVASINGVPYANLPATQFVYSNQGGAPLAEAPNYTVLNAYTFTPPVNGKVYIESLASFVSVVNFAGVNMTFAINGSNVAVSPTQTNAYASNVNFFGTNFFSFPVVANTTYDISSIAQCSALPPAGADAVVNTSRLFVMFSPQ